MDNHRQFWVPLYMVAKQYKQTIKQCTLPQTASRSVPRIDTLVARFCGEIRDHRRAAHCLRHALRHYQSSDEFGLLLTRLLLWSARERDRQYKYSDIVWCLRSAPARRLPAFLGRSRELWHLIKQLPKIDRTPDGRADNA
jgi:hypothetical protein